MNLRLKSVLERSVFNKYAECTSKHIIDTMPAARNKRERYMKWIMQVIDGIDEPFSTRDILNNWDNYAPVRYKPQMNLLTNIEQFSFSEPDPLFSKMRISSNRVSMG